MKKLLSALLCLCLLAGTVIAMTPTTSAAVTNPERFPEMERAELIYSQNFEGSDVTDAANASALISALGWSGTAFKNMEIRKDGDSNNHQLYFGANADSSMTICTDDRLAGGNYVVEYTATMLTFAAGADGAGMGFRSAGFKSTEAGWNFLLKERGNFDFHFHANGVPTGNYHSELDIAPNAETVNGSNRANGSVIGEKIRLRLVIDAENGLSAYTVDPITGEATIVVGMNEDKVAAWKGSSSTIDSAVQIRAINVDTSYLVDDIQIWSNVKTKTVPEIIGYQTTSLQNSTYDIRFIAQTKGIAATGMGFDVQYSFLMGGKTISGTKRIYCEYLYQSLTTDFGDSTLKADVENGYNYLIALAINGIPSDAKATYTVTPFALYGEDEVALGTAKNYSVTRDLLSMVPSLSGGTLASTKEFTTDYQRLYYTGTTLAEYNAYVNKLAAYGFELYDENTINGNVYKTFTTDYMVLHAYYLASKNTTSIIVTEKTNWTAYPTAPTDDPVLCDNALTMMDMNYSSQSGGQNNGMGFVYSLEDGSFVIIDGGYAAETDALFNYLSEHNHRKDGKILIRAWIITHPDGDHYKCFNEFTVKYANKVTLEYFVAQFDSIHSEAATMIYNNAAQYKGCKNIVPMPGQVMYFGPLKVEFLFTAEMYQGYTGADLTSNQTNESSLVFKAYLDDTNVLFMGDAVASSIDAVVAYYGSALKCQYFQAAHHGLNGTTALYDLILPDYLLMTTHSTATEERLDKTHSHGKQSLLYYLMNKGCVKKVYSAGEMDDVTGDEFTVLFGTVSIPVIEPETPTEVQLGNFETQRDRVLFDQLIGNN